MLACLAGYWQSFLILSLGAFILRRIPTDWPLGLRTAVSIGLGIVSLSAGVFLLLSAGLFYPPLVWFLLVFLTLLTGWAGFDLVRECGAALKDAIKADPWLALIALVLLLPQFLSGLTPEVEVDSLWYHLGVPQFYLYHHQLREMPFHLPSHYPMNYHLQYVLSLLIGNDMTAKISIVFLFFPIGTLIYSETRRRSNRTYAFLAVLIYLSSVHHRLPVMANVEQAVVFFCLLSVVFLWRWLEERREWDFRLSAFWCGIAMGTKVNGWVFAFVLNTFALGVWLLIRREWKVLLPRVAGYGAVAWLLVSPWLVKSYLLTGNPLYPFMDWPGGTHPDFVNAMLANQSRHGLNIFKSHTLAEFFAQVQTNVKWMISSNDLLFGMIPCMLAMVAVRFKTFAPQILTGGLAYGMFTFLWGSDVGRLFSVNYGMFAILTALGLWILAQYSRVGRYVFWLVAIAFSADFLYEKAEYCSYEAIDWHGDIHLSEKSRMDFIIDHGVIDREELEVFRYIEAELSPQYDLYVYQGGYPFYLNFPKILSDDLWGETLDHWLAYEGPEYAAERLRELNVGYLLRGRRPDLECSAPKYHPELNDRQRLELFLEAYAVSLKAYPHFEVFRMKWIGDASNKTT